MEVKPSRMHFLISITFEKDEVAGFRFVNMAMAMPMTNVNLS